MYSCTSDPGDVSGCRPEVSNTNESFYSHSCLKFVLQINIDSTQPTAIVVFHPQAPTKRRPTPKESSLLYLGVLAARSAAYSPSTGPYLRLWRSRLQNRRSRERPRSVKYRGHRIGAGSGITVCTGSPCQARLLTFVPSPCAPLPSMSRQPRWGWVLRRVY